jgi:hypothetical protein
MLHKICPHVVRRAQRENQEAPEKRPKKLLAHCEINLEFIEQVLNQIFSLRNQDTLSSRVKFKV